MEKQTVIPEKSKKKSIKKKVSTKTKGQLKIGNQWNAITVLALSQTNPLKAIAEFVENSIDAGASKIQIFRGRKNNEVYLRIVDNGAGIRKNPEGQPDFKYVATHICDSIKKHMKNNGQNNGQSEGVQGEYGIGLLGFWTLGEELTMRSPGEDGKIYQMSMARGKPSYEVTQQKSFLTETGGTELTIKPMLPGLKQVSGEKLQWYLGQELRNRMLLRKVSITIHDLVSRSQYEVEPRVYKGSRIYIPQDLNYAGVELEIFGSAQSEENKLSLFRRGTRVLENICELTEFQKPPWTEKFLVGHIECSFLQLNPGSRLGILRDQDFEKFVESLTGVEKFLNEELARYRHAEDEKVNKNTLQSIHKAFEGAFSALPPEEYDWFVPVKKQPGRAHLGNTNLLQDQQVKYSAESVSSDDSLIEKSSLQIEATQANTTEQFALFQAAGPLASVRIQPKTCIIKVETERKLTAICKDRQGIPCTDNLQYEWSMTGQGTLEGMDLPTLSLKSNSEPGLMMIKVKVTQARQSEPALEFHAEAIITVAAEIPQFSRTHQDAKGLPAFTYQHAPGELWRSRYEEARHLIVINSGHRDYIFASRTMASKLRYLVRLFTKELILKNFQGLSAREAMDRLIEVSQLAEQGL